MYLNHPVTTDIQRILKEEVKKLLKTVELSSEEFYNCLELEFEEYLETFKSLLDTKDIAAKLVKLGMSIPEINEFGNYCFTIAEKCWLLNHSIIFVIDLEKAKKLPPITKEEAQKINWSAINNSFITLSTHTKQGKKYLPYYMEYFDTDYTKINGEAKNKIYKYRFYGNDHNLEELDEIFTFAFTVEKFPVLFHEKTRNNTELDIGEVVCKNCKNKHFECEYTFNNVIGDIEKETVCHMSSRRKEECIAFNKEEMLIDAESALSVIAYICRMFDRRNSLIRKNSKNIEEYNRCEVELVCDSEEIEVEHKNNTSKHKQSIEVSLIDFAKDERKKNRVYSVRHNITHKTHNSPREHHRKAHTRHYKNGRVVEIPETVVNKGKDKVIYRV